MNDRRRAWRRAAALVTGSLLLPCVSLEWTPHSPLFRCSRFRRRCPERPRGRPQSWSLLALNHPFSSEVAPHSLGWRVAHVEQRGEPQFVVPTISNRPRPMLSLHNLSSHPESTCPITLIVTLPPTHARSILDIWWVNRPPWTPVGTMHRPQIQLGGVDDSFDRPTTAASTIDRTGPLHTFSPFKIGAMGRVVHKLHAQASCP